MNLLTPFLIGLFSSVHCLVMCGGLCAVFCQHAIDRKTILIINFGRILTYTFLGLIFAGIIQGLALSIPIAKIGFWIRSIFGLMLIFLGLRIIANKSSLHSFVENNFLWLKAKNKLHKITRNNSNLAHLSKGVLWGMIPCGLLYGVLVAAATTREAIQGGLFMFAFGIGTLPSMFVAAGFLSSWQQKLQSRYLRFGAGMFILIIGLWSLISPWFSHQLFPNSRVFTSVIAFLDSCVP